MNGFDGWHSMGFWLMGGILLERVNMEQLEGKKDKNFGWIVAKLRQAAGLQKGYGEGAFVENSGFVPRLLDANVMLLSLLYTIQKKYWLYWDIDRHQCVKKGLETYKEKRKFEISHKNLEEIDYLINYRTLKESTEGLKILMIRKAMFESKGNISFVAKRLGTTPKTVKKYYYGKV